MMLRGVEELADAVKVTMGPKVCCFLILADLSWFLILSLICVDLVDIVSINWKD